MGKKITTRNRKNPFSKKKYKVKGVTQWAMIDMKNNMKTTLTKKFTTVGNPKNVRGYKKGKKTGPIQF